MRQPRPLAVSMTHPGAGLAIALGCFAACGSAFAERSLLLEPGEASEAGNCEFELAAERQTARDAAPEQEASMQLDCGIGWNTELTATVARSRSDGTRAYGLGLEGKTTLGYWGLPKLGWAIEYGVAGERGDDTPWRWGEYYVALAATLIPDPEWAIEVRLGSSRDRIERRSSALWSIAVEHEFSDTFEAKVEWASDGRDSPALGVELRWEFWPDRARLNLYYAGKGGSDRERLVGAGVSVEF